MVYAFINTHTWHFNCWSCLNWCFFSDIDVHDISIRMFKNTQTQTWETGTNRILYREKPSLREHYCESQITTTHTQYTLIHLSTYHLIQFETLKGNFKPDNFKPGDFKTLQIKTPVFNNSLHFKTSAISDKNSKVYFQYKSPFILCPPSN